MACFSRETYGAIFDAHVHTCFDLHDGLITPKQMVELTRARGFNWVLAMNHDTVLGTGRVRRLARERGLPCIVGVEVSTFYNHILAYGVQEWPWRANAWDPETCIDRLREQDCAIFLSHPYLNPFNGRWTPDVVERLDIDGLEWVNASNSIRNKKVPAWFPKCPPGRRIAGTDAHSPAAFGYAYTQVATASDNPDDLVAAMKKGRCRPGGQYVPLAVMGGEQFYIAVKNKIIKKINVDGKLIDVHEEIPGSKAPEGFPPENTVPLKEIKARMKPVALAWKERVLEKPRRFSWS